MCGAKLTATQTRGITIIITSDKNNKEKSCINSFLKIVA
jgi:hypothetical protein